MLGASLIEKCVGAGGIFSSASPPTLPLDESKSVYGLAFALDSSIKPAGTITISAVHISLTLYFLRVLVQSMMMHLSLFFVNFCQRRRNVSEIYSLAATSYSVLFVRRPIDGQDLVEQLQV